MKLTRRSLIAGVAASTAASAFAKPFWTRVGLETYSFRRELAKDFDGTLALIRKMGFTEVEAAGLYGFSSQDLRKKLDNAGLRCTSMMAPDFSKDLDAIAKDAQVLGSRYAVSSWIAHQGVFSADDCAKAVDNFNRWGDKLQSLGVKFCYHVHGYEFQPSPDGTLFDTIAKQTHGGAVHFEMDTFWIAWPGQDPAALLEKYSGRFLLMHLKDLKKGVKGDLTGGAPDEYSVPVGDGSIDWPKVLGTAAKSGVERFYIEDENQSAMRQVPKSMEYLQKLKI